MRVLAEAREPVRSVFLDDWRNLLLIVGLRFAEVLPCFSLGHNAISAVQPTFFAELFPADRRCTGAAAGREIASVFAGGLTPFAATALAGPDGARWTWVAAYVTAGALLTVVAVWQASEIFHRDLKATGTTVR